MQHDVSQHDLAGDAKLLAINIPNTITYYWASFFRAGHSFVPAHLYEMPHLAEHLAFAGTRTWPDPLAFNVEIERDGTSYNARTGWNWVWYDFAGSRDGATRIIPLNMSQIYEPLFEQERIEQEKAVIVQEMNRNKENDNWRLNYLNFHRVMPESNPDMETRIAGIKDITKEDLMKYHKAYYGTANTRFVLAGEFDHERVAQVKQLLNSHLEKQAAGQYVPFRKLITGDYGDTVEAYEPFRDSQALFMLRFFVPERDELMVPALSVIRAMCTGGLSARLFRKAREGGLTYGISAQVGDDNDFTTFSVSSQTSIDKLEQLIELTARELKFIGDGEFSDEELERAVGYLVGGTRRANQTPANYAMWYADQFLCERPMEAPEEWVAKIAAVDRMAINRAYKKFFTRRHMLLTMIGKDLGKQTKEYQKMLHRHFA